jgi:membrane protein YdbS with pleckstrin-like domain
MRLSAPKKLTWWVAVILGVVGVVGLLVTTLPFSGFAQWLVVAAFVLLALATFVKGL